MPSRQSNYPATEKQNEVFTTSGQLRVFAQHSRVVAVYRNTLRRYALRGISKQQQFAKYSFHGDPPCFGQ